MFVRTILRKREGQPLAAEEIRDWIRGVSDGSIPDYQSAALLMAIALRGMTPGETAALTDAMLRSGRALTWDGLDVPTVDKHSTGGVGDKISIALAPWVASCGVAVPMIAGRGLGHTGGTLDKLEAIPGFRTRLGAEELDAQVRRVHVAIAGQGADLAPADGILYALRDVTGTVESVPLIVASIVSKKAASGTACVVYDVKCGRGAFMRTRAEAGTLARELVAATGAMGRGAAALVTTMDQPIGAAVGNAIETAEALDVLRDEAPSDVMELTRTLGVEMLLLARAARDRSEAESKLRRALASGDAARRAERWIEAQGGDPRVVTDRSRLPRAPVETRARAAREGVVARIDARAIGMLLVAMGGGRTRKEDGVDPAVGIRIVRKVGARVAEGEALAVVEAHRDAPEWAAAAADAFTIAADASAPPDVVLERVNA